MLLLLLLTNTFVLLPWAGAGRIIGGWEVKPHSRPYMASLKVQNATNSSRCGGFLIRSDAVLSAAHCVDMEGTVRITVILGAHIISDRERSQQRIRAGHWVIHPNYSRVGLKNDIMLLKLDPKPEINEDVQLISFASSNEHVRVGDKCKVLGWGQTSVKGNRSNVLREVDLKVQNETICQKRLPRYQRQSMICVGDESSKKASYRGDSGGPLVCNGKAYGIVSHGPTGYLFPKAYTSVSYFEPWIREQLRKFALQDLPGSPSSD